MKHGLADSVQDRQILPFMKTQYTLLAITSKFLVNYTTNLDASIGGIINKHIFLIYDALQTMSRSLDLLSCFFFVMNLIVLSLFIILIIRVIMLERKWLASFSCMISYKMSHEYWYFCSYPHKQLLFIFQRQMIGYFTVQSCRSLMGTYI